MLLRHSPAVSYPLHRSRAMQGVWAIAMLGSAIVLVLWWWQGAGLGWSLGVRVGLSAALWLLCGAWAWQALNQCASGGLRWDGKCWYWVRRGQPLALPASPVVVCDVQWLLIIAFAGEKGKPVQRFVLQRDWAPHDWLDVRRAVYSLAHPASHAADSQTP